MEKYKKIDRGLVIGAYVFLAIPIIIWLAGWFKWYISLIGISCLAIALLVLFKKFKYKTQEEYKNIFVGKKMIPFVISIILLNMLSGAGGIFFQTWDYRFRNTVFQDLIEKDWPVTYDYSTLEKEKETIGSEKGMLSYYFAWWLPSATIGKVTNFTVASLFALLWQTLGSIFFFYLVIRKMGKIKLKYFLVFLAFGGADIIGTAIMNHCFGKNIALIGTSHIDTWNGTFCMSTFITQLFWVFNQSVPAWIAIMLVTNEKDYSKLGLIVALLLPFGPFPTIGLILYSIVVIVFGFDLHHKIDKNRIKSLFSLPNILGVLAVIPIGLIFMQNSSPKGFLFLRDANNSGFGKVIILYLLFLVLEIGIYTSILTKKNKRKLLSLFAICAVLPLFYIGDGVDLGNRATIPILVLIYIEVLKFIETNKKKGRQILLILILCITFMTNFNELYRSVYNRIADGNDKLFVYADSYQTFAQFEGKECERLIKNFVAPYNENKFFYQRILK